ncbi:MAG: ABC transporter permease [Gammaproteobacteria bacterium]|nr:ABC transporter permease [Gammaproteobacteria bacterium]
MSTWLSQLLAAVIKETKLILRDREALAILFIMPSIFVLIMSLALQDAFREQGGIKFEIIIIDKDKGETGERLTEAFAASASFVVRHDDELNETELQKRVTAGDIQFAIYIPENSTQLAIRRAEQELKLSTGSGQTRVDEIAIRMFADPAVRGDYRSLVASIINRVLQGIETRLMLQAFSKFRDRVAAMSSVPIPKPPKQASLFAEVTDPYLGSDKSPSTGPTPTSVQVNAPGWGLLAMFFLVIPLASTLAREHQEGSLTRLQVMAAPTSMILMGKIVPYFVINQIQIALILLEGVVVLPLLGGEQLELGPHPQAIAVLSICVSLAAVGYGLLVAAFARTPEQATIFGATSVLVLAALGGIMVPKMVMPPAMQELTVISPLSWALDGYVDIFVRGADTIGILDKAGALVALGAICLFIGVQRFNYRLRHG